MSVGHDIIILICRSVIVPGPLLDTSSKVWNLFPLYLVNILRDSCSWLHGLIISWRSPLSGGEYYVEGVCLTGKFLNAYPHDLMPQIHAQTGLKPIFPLTWCFLNWNSIFLFPRFPAWFQILQWEANLFHFLSLRISFHGWLWMEIFSRLNLDADMGGIWNMSVEGKICGVA